MIKLPELFSHFVNQDGTHVDYLLEADASAKRLDHAEPNASRDLSDLILRKELDRLAKNPGDKKAAKRIAQETTRRTDLKMNYEDDGEVVIEKDGTLRAKPQEAQRDKSGGSAGEVVNYAYDEAKHPRGEHGRWVEALGGIGHGELKHVGGLLVRRTGHDEFRAETDTGHVTGDANKLAGHIVEDHARRALHGKKRHEALRRGGDAKEPDALTDPNGHQQAAQGFAKLPKGAKVVSLHPDTHGRIGTIEKDELGRNKVKFEGTPGHGSDHVEPLDEKHSWRKASPTDPGDVSATAAGDLFKINADGTLPKPKKVKQPKREITGDLNEDTADLFRVKPEQGRLFAELERLNYQDKGNGHWITIGSKKNVDGQKHGGSPVYIENGRITKGHPSLTGKKIGHLKEPAEPSEHHKRLAHLKAQPKGNAREEIAKKKEMATLNATISRGDTHAEKHYQRAVLVKKAKKLGIDEESLHQLAADMKAHHDAHTTDVKAILQRTRDAAKKQGINVHHANKEFHGGDTAGIKGFDELARQMAGEYPHVLGNHGYSSEQGFDAKSEEASEKLFELLQAGNPEPMSDEQAYTEAFDHLAAHAHERLPAPSDDPIPFSIGKDGILHYAAHDVSQEKRDQGGRWTEGGGGTATMERPKFSAPKGTTPKRKAVEVGKNGVLSSSAPQSVASKALAGVKAELSELKGDLGHTYHKVHGLAEGAYHALPKPLQEAVACSAGLAFAGWTASQILAENIAREKGATPEEAKQIGKTLATNDLKWYKPTVIAAHVIGGPVGHALAQATWVVPPATAWFILKSAATNLPATLRAAGNMVRDAVHEGGRLAKTIAGAGLDLAKSVAYAEETNARRDGGSVPSAEQMMLAYALEKHGYDEWFGAILHKAILEAKDARQALTIAERAFAQHPADVSTPRDDDADALFAEPQQAQPEQPMTFAIGPDGVLRYSTDASGHEHKGPGPGGGQFTSSGTGGISPAGVLLSPHDRAANKLLDVLGRLQRQQEKPKPGQRAAELHAKQQELKQARIDAFRLVKMDAQASLKKAGEHVGKLKDLAGNIAYDSDDDHSQPFADLESLLEDLDGDATPGEQFSALKDIEATTKEALDVDLPKALPDNQQRAAWEKAAIDAHNRVSWANDGRKVKLSPQEIGALAEAENAKLEAAGNSHSLGAKNFTTADGPKGELVPDWSKGVSLNLDDEKLPKGFSPDEIKEIKGQLHTVIQNASKARQELKAYVQHRKEMQAIKAGQPVHYEDGTRVDFSVSDEEMLRFAYTSQSIDLATMEIHPNPSFAQRAAGNHKMAHVTISGLDITIECAKGNRRKPHHEPLKNHYGYIKRTISADGEKFDCFLGPSPQSEIVYIVDQLKKDGSFDESKAMIGFTNAKEAKDAYLSNYPSGFTGFGGMKALTMDAFKEWLKNGDTGSPAAPQTITFAAET